MKMYAGAKQSHFIPSNELFRCHFSVLLEITISQCITPKTNAWMIKPYSKDEEQKRNNKNKNCI